MSRPVLSMYEICVVLREDMKFLNEDMFGKLELFLSMSHSNGYQEATQKMQKIVDKKQARIREYKQRIKDLKEKLNNP